VDEFPSIVTWSLSSVVAVMLVALRLTPAGEVALSTAVRAWVLAVVLGFAFRSVTRAVWRHATPPERTLIVGDGPLAHATRRKLDLFPDIHARVVDQRQAIEDALAAAQNGSSGVDRVIVASGALDEAQLAELMAVCREAKIKLDVVPPLRGMFGTAVQLQHVADLPVLAYNTWEVSWSTMLLKRTVDVVVAALATVLAAPLFLVIAVAVRLDSRGPVFFVQTRAGRGGRPFRMLKFRTMIPDAEQALAEIVPFDQLDEPMFKLVDDPRVTRVGRLLRRMSLDELPQLVNVLRGDMSLVGPRPEQVELVERYRDDERVHLVVRPGLTGPMQVFGRSNLSFAERLAVERDYVENLSLSRDLRLLLLTGAAVFRARGAY
jgi:exopolysaccharide biosynthesis polyprenyl glycosylphosphotransferase